MQALREMKQVEDQDPTYKSRVSSMDKLELLEEMVHFQEERTRIGELTVSMMVRGRILFKALEENAETDALKSLTSAYRRHLEFELTDYLARSAKKASG